MKTNPRLQQRPHHAKTETLPRYVGHQSHRRAAQTGEEAATQKFYQYIGHQNERFELCISPVVELEIDNCPQPKQSKLKSFVRSLDCTRLPVCAEAEELVAQYIRLGVLGAKHYRDLTHIAYAVTADCNFILSWNFKHFVNFETPDRVNAVNLMYQYRRVEIVSPLNFTGGFSNDSV